MADENEEKKSVTINLRIRPEVRDYLEGVRKRTGVPATELLVRVFDWLAQEPWEVMREILERGDVDRTIVQHYFASRAAEGDLGKLTGALTDEQAAQMALKAVDQLYLITLAYKRELRSRLNVDLEAGELKFKMETAREADAKKPKKK